SYDTASMGGTTATTEQGEPHVRTAGGYRRQAPEKPGGDESGREALPGEGGCGSAHRAEELDARRLPQDADPADLAARPFRDRRHAAGRQLADPGADLEA